MAEISRYLNLSFKDDILPWLKSYVLSNVQSKDIYLLSAIEQYIDHLEGKFSLRTIDKKMNMELQKFIEKELKLTSINPEEALNIVSTKKQEMTYVINQLKEMEESIKVDHFKKWAKLLKKEFPNYKEIGNWETHDTLINIGLTFDWNDISFYLLIEYNHESLYYGIRKHDDTDEKVKSNPFKEIIEKCKLEGEENEWWYAWNYALFSDIYENFKLLIEAIENSSK